MMTGPASSVESRRAPGGVRSRRSNTTRIERPLAGRRSRAVSSGIVDEHRAEPTAIASTSRAHRVRVPVAPAPVSCVGAPRGQRRPAVEADRRLERDERPALRMSGRRTAALSRAGCSAPRPRRRPRCRARGDSAKPRPLTSGLGSSIAATTRATSGLHDARDARAGAADVAARLERAVQRRAARARPGIARARASRRAARRPARGSPAAPPRRRVDDHARRPSDWGWSARGRARRGPAHARHVVRAVASSSRSYHFSSNSAVDVLVRPRTAPDRRSPSPTPT